MKSYDPVPPDRIRSLYEDFRAHVVSNPVWARWRTDILEFLPWVRAASIEERRSLGFQTRLWNLNPIAAVGQGDINIDDALADPEFRRWLVDEAARPLPDDAATRIARLQGLYEEIIRRLRAFTQRNPRLKTYRVLTALFPDDFTTIAAEYKLRDLHKMVAGRRETGVACHAGVLRSLDRVIEWKSDGADRIFERMSFPWYLWQHLVEPSEEATESPDPTGPQESFDQAPLVPIPAARRRRGLTALKGGYQTVLRVLDFVSDGVSREDLLGFLRADRPEGKESTLGTIINILQAELAVVKRSDDQYTLTPQGAALLETENPSTLAAWLLTRILGPDAALVALRDDGRLSHGELVGRIQALNPGWTTTFVPASIIQWLRSLGFIATDAEWRLRLTTLGEEWARRIHWKPEGLPADADVPIAPPSGRSGVGEHQPVPSVSVPPLKSILGQLQGQGFFPRETVATLHAGLWTDSRRHFAILTGLSGSGKTLLAHSYGLALAAAGGVADAARFVRIVPVSPGWTDPAAVLGYVNPLGEAAYVKTPFLEFLLMCHEDPARPYVAIFDEMNLSHPEQYLAPLLSAMETGAEIELHTAGDDISLVPERLRYPSNLVLIGTVNMDETTHGVSDKVLDRALTLEFWDVRLENYPEWGRTGLPSAAEGRARALLTDLHQALAPGRLHFGWRVLGDVLKFLVRATVVDQSLDLVDALDRTVHAKILPRLRGEDSARFRKVLADAEAILVKHELRLSAQKVAELAAELKLTGAARFWR